MKTSVRNGILSVHKKNNWENRGTSGLRDRLPEGRVSYLRMPREARALASPWPRLAGSQPGLTTLLEDEFRFGQMVILFGEGKYRIGGSIKGGGSALWTPASREEYEIYQNWNAIESFREEENPEARREMVAYLASAGVMLVEPGGKQRRQPHKKRRGQLYGTMRDIVKRLPFEHLESKYLQRIVLGGNGPDAAKCSAYEEPELILYEFAMRGARRTFIGLFLHELGHVFSMSFNHRQRRTLLAYHDLITRNNSLIGLEFLLTPEVRIMYQSFPLEEFIAEFYLQYTACGSLVREHISRVEDEQVRTAWRAVYDIFRRSFGGIEYE